MSKTLSIAIILTTGQSNYNSSKTNYKIRNISKIRAMQSKTIWTEEEVENNNNNNILLLRLSRKPMKLRKNKKKKSLLRRRKRKKIIKSSSSMMRMEELARRSPLRKWRRRTMTCSSL